ncbi:MAG TPA: YfhO family protein [Nocardioidaceae bacterium]|nr:YfhO family protein [Nocardioidaceae bacterium]
MARSPERRYELLVWALLGLAGALVIGPALLGRGVLLDVGLISRHLPWIADAGVRAGSVWCRGDTVDGVFPAIANIRESLFRGDLPTWSPYEVGGAPLASLPNSAMLNPLTWPYFVLPLWLAPAYVKLLEVVVAVAGMVAFLGRHGVRRSAALLAGLIFATSGFMVMWSNWPQTRVAAFIPALFWALERVVSQRRSRDVALLGLVLGCMILGGFPSVTLYALTAGAVYVVARGSSLYLLRAREWGRFVGAGAAAGLGVVLGVALSAVQLLPFIHDLGVLNLEGRDFAGTHLDSAQFLTTLAPDVHGSCVDGDRFGTVNPVEAIAFLGVGALVLILCAVALPAARGKQPAGRLMLATLLAAVTVVVWLGGPLLSVLDLLPFYASNFIGRATSVFAFLGAALAGYGMDRLLAHAQPPDSSKRRAPTLLVGLSVTLIIAFIAYMSWQAYGQARDLDYTGSFRDALAMPAVLLLVATLAAVLGRGRLRWLGAVVLAAVIALQGGLFAHQLLPLNSRDAFYPTTTTHAFLQQHVGAQRYASGDAMYPATSDFYRLRTPVGHDFTSPRWGDLITAVDPTARQSPTHSYFADRPLAEVAEDRILDQFSVRYWVSGPQRVGGIPDRVPSAGSTDTLRLRDAEISSCVVPGGPLRGIRLFLQAGHAIHDRGVARVNLRVTTPQGVFESERALDRQLRRGPLDVAVAAGPDTSVDAASLPTGGSYEVAVWFDGVRGQVQLRGSAEGAHCAALRPDDGLHLVHSAAGALTFERATALPRIRWAGSSRVVTDPAERVALLQAGILDDQVLLESPDLPVADGSTAELDVRTDEAERIEATVTASGDGYLVVGDSIVRDGWRATVDGQVVDLVYANHAFAGVPVPAGEHQVSLTYTAPGLRTGALVSLGALAVCGLLLLWPLLARRRDPSARSGDQVAAS